MIRVFALDDEAPGLKNLINLIQRLGESDVEIVGQSSSPLLARAEVERLKPDLLFLDVQMPGITGLEFLSTFVTIQFEVVFVTAHEEYALQAIKAGALDYILKPVSLDDVRQAFNKYRKKHSENHQHSEDSQRLALPSKIGYRLVPITEIRHVKGEDNYSTVHLASGENIMISRTLKDVEEKLKPPRFFRIHKSHMINLSEVKEYSLHDGGFVVMNDGERLDISRRRLAEFREMMEQFLLGNRTR
jgi:two-component system LytT family response regulator